MERIILLSFICYIFCWHSAKAQSWDWVIKTGNSLSDEAHSIGIDKQANVYVTGSDYNFTGGGGSGGSYYSEWLFKFDPTGQLSWKTQLDITVTKSVTDSIGNVYITAGNFVEKYSSGGTKLWSKYFANAVMRNILLHPEGGIVISGENILGTAPQFDGITLSGDSRYFLARIDETGTPLWATEEANDFYLSSLALDRNNKLYSFGSGGAGNKHIRRYSNSGQLEIQLTPGLNGSEDKICTDGNGNLFIVGTFDDHNPLNVNGITYTCNCPQKSSIYIIKYDSVGTAIWIKIISGYLLATKNHIITDKNNNLYLASSFTSMTIDNVSISSVGTNGAVIKFDQDGNIIWIKNSSGTTGTYTPLATPAGITLNSTNEIFIAGSLGGNVSFDSFSFSHQSMYKDMFVAKINDINVTGINDIENSEISGNASLQIYPNPPRGQFVLNYFSEDKGDLTIRIIDNIGQEIYYENTSTFDGNLIKNIDLSRKAAGIYNIEILNDKTKIVKRVVLN